MQILHADAVRFLNTGLEFFTRAKAIVDERERRIIRERKARPFWTKFWAWCKESFSMSIVSDELDGWRGVRDYQGSINLFLMCFEQWAPYVRYHDSRIAPIFVLIDLHPTLEDLFLDWFNHNRTFEGIPLWSKFA